MHPVCSPKYPACNPCISPATLDAPSLQPYVSQVQRVVDLLHLSQVELLIEDDPELLAHTHIKSVEVRVVPNAIKVKGGAAPPMCQLLLEPVRDEISRLAQTVSS